jgi:DHA1 family tetracycline resistance protein-like MFS transporter
VIGPAVGGLAALGGTRLPFFVAAGIAGLNAAVAVRRLPETRPQPGVAGTGRGDGVPGALGSALRAMAVPGAVTVMLVASFSAFEATFALFGQRRLGFGLAAIGAVFAMVGVVAAGVQGGLVHPLAARVGNAGCLRIGLVAEGLGLVLLPTVHSRVDLVLPLVLVTAGQSLSTPALNAVVAGRVGAGSRGSALGAQQGFSALARVIGPALGGLAYELLGTGAPFVGGGLVVAAALLFSLVMRSQLLPLPERVVEEGGHRLPLGNNG